MTTKVDYKSKCETGGFEVGQALRTVQRNVCLRGFALDNKPIVNKKINAIRFAKIDSFINEMNWYLLLYCYTTLTNFVCKG